MRYLLDTKIVSDLVRNPQGKVAQHIRSLGEAQVCTSIIVAAELGSGVIDTMTPLPRIALRGSQKNVHHGSRPSLKQCSERLKFCPSNHPQMLPTDCCVPGLSNPVGQSAPMTCSLRLRRLHLVIPS